MRHFAVLAFMLPSAGFADQILVSSHITAITVYPQGAQVTRDVSFSAAAGPHDLLITDLPADTMAEMIRLSSDSASLGAFSLRTDRLPPRDDATNPDVVAAKAAVEAAELGVQQAQAVIDGINARVEAAGAQADFLRGVKAKGDAVTVDGVKALASMIGAEVLAARQAALVAQGELPAAQKGLETANEALAKAQAAQEALSQRDSDYAALSVAVDLPSDGEAHLSVTHYVQNAYWQPVYDLMLTRKDTPSLTIKRGVLVTQDTGEDWAGVDLTLSTAQPSTQSEPSHLYTELRRIEDEQPEAKAGADMAMADGEAPVMAEPAAVVVSTYAFAGMKGDVVVYHYPKPVDVATGVENLRLALDEIKVTPQIEARAVPRYDSTGFVFATFVNESNEILLPGQAVLMREGELVGSTDLDAVAPGDKAEVGFGAIDGLRLTRDMPVRAEGDRGVFTTSTQIEEKAVLKVENLTQESWPVRLLDQVPYSEQEDLSISFTADPEPSETDVDGQRGILAWQFDLAPGETKEVALQHVISWPEGKVLR